VCGDTLFSLARQGLEFLPGKFTDIDWMTASGGGRSSAIGGRIPANKCREVTGDDQSATAQCGFGSEAEIQTETLPTSRALAGKMRVLKRVIARAGFLPGSYMLIWP
jgi:hypothetical protein